MNHGAKSIGSGDSRPQARSAGLPASVDAFALLQCLCTSFVHADDGAAVRAAVSPFKDWAGFVALAAEHRLLPLAYWVFKRLGVEAPRQVKRVMASAYLREKALAARQQAAMLQALAALQAAGIQALVLKGGVVSHLLYPEPGLRPMEDIDILVAPDQDARARDVLLALGYTAPAEASRFDRLQHQLPLAHRDDQGHAIGIEIHREVFNHIVDCRLDFSVLDRPFAQTLVGGTAISHLGLADMLWVQYRGLRKLAEPLRLLHLVDLARLAERLPTGLGGGSLRRQYPELWNALVALDRFIPLSSPTRQFLGLPPRIDQAQDAVGLDYLGWPRRDARPAASEGGRMDGQRLWQTFWPKRWWAEFFHGLPPQSARWRIELAHLGLFIGQGWRRLMLGPINAHSFFKRETAAASSPPALAPAEASTVLVTCMYNGLAGSPFGGRLNRDQLYRESLATIARASGLPILCFVAASELAAHQAFFEGRPHRITWLPLELGELAHSAEIQRIKAAHPGAYQALAWQERCVEIMWGKFQMLTRALALCPQASHLFWLDAGLANVNIISTKYTQAEALQAGDLYRVDAAFRPELFQRMRALAGERLQVLLSTAPHNPGIPEKYNAHPYRNGHAVVGGLFGGGRAVVRTVCQLFEQKCQRLLADDLLCFEEGILTGVLADRPDLFETFTFDTWYHEGWASHDPNEVNFSQFFDQVLGEPAPGEPVKFPWNP